MNFLRRNFSLKAASLILAIGVWFYVRGEEKPVQILSVPLELQNIPDDLAISGDVMETVSVRVRAPEVVLRGLETQTPLARADLSALGPGEQFVRISPSSISLPPEAEVVRINPEYVPVRLEKKVRKNLPVSPRIAGEPASGYVLGGDTVQPNRVPVEGPESAVEKSGEVETGLVRIDGRAQPFDVVVDLFPDTRGVRVVNVRSAVVSVDIHVRYVTRAFADVPLEAVGVSGGVRIDPAKIDVILEGPPSALNALDPNDVGAVVDLSEPPQGRKGIRLVPRVVFRQADMDSHVTVKTVTPAEVTVRARPRRTR